jgi:hypothetical protein
MPSHALRRAASLAAAVLLLAGPAAGQAPDTLAAPAPAEAPVRRNAFGGVERREPLGGAALLVGNVVAQSALTVGRGLAEGGRAGQVPAFALGGAAAGAGFYGAKRLVGAQRTVAGFALAYASASLAENVAEGGHALSHVRLGLGPLDLRVATGLGRDGGPGVAVEVEPLSVAAAVVLPLRGFRPRPCAAGVCYRGAAPERVVRGGRRFRRLGRTVGRVVRVWPPFSGRTEAHEGVHVVQGMQVAAATPGGTLRALLGERSEARVALDVRTDWLAPLAGGLVYALVRYERAWTEREAFTLAGPDAASP